MRNSVMCDTEGVYRIAGFRKTQQLAMLVNGCPVNGVVRHL